MSSSPCTTPVAKKHKRHKSERRERLESPSDKPTGLKLILKVSNPTETAIPALNLVNIKYNRTVAVSPIR